MLGEIFVEVKPSNESQKDGKSTLKKRVLVNIKEPCTDLDKSGHSSKRLLKPYSH